MEHRTLSRVLSAALFAVLAGAASHRFAEKQREMGKDAFLARQEQRFDRFYAEPGNGRPQYWAAVFTAGLFGAYELLALGIHRLIRRPPEGS